MSRKSLENILGEESETVAEIRASLPEPEQETGVTPEEPEAPEPEVEAGPPPADDARKGLEAGIAAERKKRQEIEAQLEQLRREVTAKPKEPEAPPPSMWEDDQAWQQHFGGQVVSAAVTQASYQNKLSTSEFYARKNIDGFDKEWEPLNKWLSDNPSLAQQAAGDYDPWGYAFRAYKNQQTMQELGATDIEQLKAQIREQIMAEQQASAPVAMPLSLSTKRSVSGRTGPAWAGPKPLKDLL